MNPIRRLSRKIQRNEKFFSIFARYFCSSSIFALGCFMLWNTDQRSDYYTYVIRNQQTESHLSQEYTGDTAPVQDGVGYSEETLKDENDSILSIESRKGLCEEILYRTSYKTSYNRQTRNPNWTAWKLTSDHTSGPVGRKNFVFMEDSNIKEPRSSPVDYSNSGFDRGHMCPAGDNKWSAQAMMETFYMTNICPQNQDLNSKVWLEIEESCRQWADKYDEIYIVCGPIYHKGEHRYIGKNRVVVPDAFFKAVIRLIPEPCGIGFICPNKPLPRGKDNYVSTIDDIEAITGYKFFTQLPEDIQKEVKQSSDLRNWKVK